MSDERMQILKMVESGKLSAEEASRLLEAVEVPQSQAVRGEAKHVRIRVLERGRKEVNVRVPIGLVGFLLRFIPEGAIRDESGRVQILDIRQIEAAIKAGQTGRIVEVEHESSRVEIFLE